MPFQELRATKTATIAASGNLSAAVDLTGGRLVGVVMPAAWTAANLTLQGSADGSTYNNVYDASGNEYSITAAAARFIACDVGELDGIRYVKMRSGTAGTPVAQAAERAITLVLRSG